eukprot:6478316-Amphidinium_carterae.1
MRWCITGSKKTSWLAVLKEADLFPKQALPHGTRDVSSEKRVQQGDLTAITFSGSGDTMLACAPGAKGNCIDSRLISVLCQRWALQARRDLMDDLEDSHAARQLTLHFLPGPVLRDVEVPTQCVMVEVDELGALAFGPGKVYRGIRLLLVVCLKGPTSVLSVHLNVASKVFCQAYVCRRHRPGAVGHHLSECSTVVWGCKFALDHPEGVLLEGSPVGLYLNTSSTSSFVCSSPGAVAIPEDVLHGDLASVLSVNLGSKSVDQVVAKVRRVLRAEALVSSHRESWPFCPLAMLSPKPGKFPDGTPVESSSRAWFDEGT